jgi:hypothetical protein
MTAYSLQDPSHSYQRHRRLLWLPDEARNMGIHLMAGKGSGKSRLMGRVIGWLDFIRGIPLVILDPVGPTLDNFLDKTRRLPKEYQEKLWKRVLYVDMSGNSGGVVGLPLYYRLGKESLYAIAQRYLDVVRRVDPALQSASVEGWNPLWRIGTHTGMILSALGLQITEAEPLLTHPQAWLPRIHHAVETYPELQVAASFFTEQYIQWKEDKQVSRTDAFRTKTALLTIDPTMRAMFGAERPSIDWARVVEKRQAILLDFRHVHDLERRRFLMLWAYMSLLEFVKHRGAGRHRPISLIVDELAALANFRTSSGSSLFADDLEELINVYARNCMLWLTLAHQEMYQFEERIQKTLMTMGTHIFGVTSDPEAALTVARNIFFYDPTWLKRLDPLYMADDSGPYVVDHRPVEFTAEEQAILNSAIFRQLRTFHFLVRPATGEGTVTRSLTPVSIENFDRGKWVDDGLVGRARQLLSQRGGVSIQEQLATIEKRLQMHPEQAIGRMNTYESRDDLSVPKDDDAELYEEKAPSSEESRDKRTAWVPTHLSRR